MRQAAVRGILDVRDAISREQLMDDFHVVDIWIEAEEWAPDEWDVVNDNTDVAVILSDGSRWIATFFTYQNILSLAEENKTTGECRSGAYFWASDMILVDQISRRRIEEIVHHLVTGDEDDLREIFSRDESTGGAPGG